MSKRIYISADYDHNTGDRDVIDKYYACKSVAIPILGSGITRYRDESLTQQQLLDIIIVSYKMSPHKIKRPAELHIICRECDDFSLNKLGKYI